MKTMHILTFLLAGLASMILNKVSAAGDKYTEAMQKNIMSVYTAKTIDELQVTVNAFERIGDAEKTKWEPQYYASFGYIMMSTREKDAAKQDAFLDQAFSALEKAKLIAPDESEIVALEGFIYMMQVSVDPASRGPRLMGQTVQLFEKALKLNPENPRALALLAQMQFGAAQFFKSSTVDACTTNDAALQKFETFKSDNPVAPQWGKQMAEEMKGNCK
jgi:tetratricopeptide (TPR) repeat protein